MASGGSHNDGSGGPHGGHTGNFGSGIGPGPGPGGGDNEPSNDVTNFKDEAFDPMRSPHHNPRGLGLPNSENDPFGYNLTGGFLPGEKLPGLNMTISDMLDMPDPIDEMGDLDEEAQNIIDKRENSLMRNFFKGFLGIALAPLTMGLSLGLTGSALGKGVSTVGGIAKDANSLKGLRDKGSTVAASHLEGMADRTSQSRADRAKDTGWDSDNRTVGEGTPLYKKSVNQQVVASPKPKQAGLSDYKSLIGQGRGMAKYGKGLANKAQKKILNEQEKQQLVNETKKLVQGMMNKYGGSYV